MIVVSDTSPITNLVDVGRINLLCELFGEVVIPPAVARELERGGVELPEFVEIRNLRDPAEAGRLRREFEIDAGEAEAIVLALELAASRSLIDEVRGRAVAARVGLKYIGVLGLLIEAKRRGYVDEVRPILDDLVQTAGFLGRTATACRDSCRSGRGR